MEFNFIRFQMKYRKDENFLKTNSLEEHLSNLKELRNQLDKPRVNQFVFENELSDKSQIYSIGYRTSSFSQKVFEENYLEKNYEEVSDINLSTLSTYRIELEDLIQKNFKKHLKSCEYRHESIIEYYYQFLKNNSDSISASYKENLHLFTEEIIHSLYKGSPSVMKDFIQMQDEDKYKSKSLLEDFVKSVYLNIKPISGSIYETAASLTLKHFLVQERIAELLLDSDKIIDFKSIREKQKQELKSKLSTAKGKINYILRLTSEENITQKEALEKANKLAEKTTGQPCYASYSSFKSSLSQFRKRES